MSTSGTSNFNLDFIEIAEEAWERAGRPMMSGYDLRTARRSMNLLMLEWQNRGINMFTIDEGQIPLFKGEHEYPLPPDTIDVLEAVLRTDEGELQSQRDLSVNRISVSTYATIPNKLSRGRPTQMWISRGTSEPVLTLWPVPDKGERGEIPEPPEDPLEPIPEPEPDEPYYRLQYWRIRRINDSGTGVNTPDVNARFLPALVAGLAYHISVKVPELSPRADMLKGMYEECFAFAAREDREKATMRLLPRFF